MLGRVEREVAVKIYAEGWRQKVERNGSLNFPKGLRYKVYDNPVVTVAIRSDGTVESVYINRSSGMSELDQAVGQIIAMLAPFSAFPPELAREYDVLEIRRVWIFGDTLELLDEPTH